jgi:hypothetical protein
MSSTNVASMATDARPVGFGDLSRFVVREVGGLDYSDLVDATSFVHLHLAVT